MPIVIIDEKKLHDPEMLESLIKHQEYVTVQTKDGPISLEQYLANRKQKAQ